MSNQTIGVLFEEYYDQFKNHLKYQFKTLNEYDAEDIIQQTIIKLLTKSDDITGIVNLKSYVFTALSNGAKDYFKKYDRVEIHEANSEHFTEQETITTEEIILFKELKAIIKKALWELDPKLRFVFIENEIRGRSYQDLMKETGEKLGTLLSRKNRAKKKLQKAIKNYLEN